MSLPDFIPGMKSGSTGRNIVVAFGYFVTSPLWVLFSPFIACGLVWRDYGGLATALSGLPGISAGGGMASGAVAFLLCLVLLGILTAALPGGGGDAPEQTTAAADPQGDGVTSATPTPTKEEPVTDGGTATSAAEATPTESTSPTAEPTATPTPTPTATPTPTPTATPTPTPVPAQDGESFQFSGSGNDVTESFETSGGLVTIDFKHNGESNFQVRAVSTDGDEKYLVNDIGAYDGEVALYLPSGEWNLDITADGGWSANIEQPRFNQQDVKSLPAEGDSEHAAWFGPFEFEGTTEVTFEIENDRQAGVWLATHDGRKVDLLHNEVGPYEGSALITDDGVGLIIVDTDSADWRIEIGG